MARLSSRFPATFHSRARRFDTGDGWSARYEDAATHGCVPVIVMDHTLGPFEALIDYSSFALRVGEGELGGLVEHLMSVTPQRLAQLQEGLARAWMRFR